jgi:hypothetical protein
MLTIRIATKRKRILFFGFTFPRAFLIVFLTIKPLAYFMNYTLCSLIIALCLFPRSSYSQHLQPDNPEESSSVDQVLNFPSRFFSRIQHKTASLDQQVTRQTGKYLQTMARQEEKLKKKLNKVDPTAAQQLFSGSAQQYAALQKKMTSDTGGRKAIPLTGEYQPYTDSLKATLSFLQQNPQLSGGVPPPSVQSSISHLQQLQAKMQDANEAKAFIQQRKQEIGSYISQHASLQSLLGPQFQAMNQEVYYYSQQVRQYKEMLNNPDQMEQKALSVLDRLPSFQQFISKNSQLAGLFNTPPNYGSAASLAGLQTRAQVGQLIQNQLASGGPGAASALTANLHSAQQQLDQYKQKLAQLGGGSGDIDMPAFKPNNQKIKTFWKRIQLGADLQTTRTNYYWPTLTTIGLSAGYKLSDKSTIGVGVDYEISWGVGINHIALSGQGAGLRSFLDIKIKGTWSASGGLEYNYTTPIHSLQHISSLGDWTRSGLIGVSKTVSVKNRLFKQTKLQLLWDFLSYQQIPKTQPIIFRVGYNF